MFETDEEDFTPSSSSNLSSIFNATLPSNETTTLSYKAPKQPKPQGNVNVVKSEENVNKEETQSPSQSSVILAKVITLWKLDNGRNTILGKHIVAIIGSISQNLYEIIVYQEKTNILIRQVLNESLSLYKYPNNFVGIFDNKRQFWNLGFDTLESQESFFREVSKHNCQIIEHKSCDSTNDQVDNAFSSSSSVQMEPSEDTKEKLKSNEHRDQASDSKERILSRITKMGHQILPRSSIERKVSTELSDSETESTNSDPKPTKPTTAPRKFRRNNYEKALSTPLITETPMLPTPYNAHGNQIYSNNNQMLLNPQGLVYSHQPYQDYGLNNFILTQNAELKANLAEINLKLNSVLNTSNLGVDKNGNNEETNSLKSKIKCLNLKIENLSADLEKLRFLYEELMEKYNLKCTEVVKEQEKSLSRENLVEEVSRLKEELCKLKLLRVENEMLSREIKEKCTLLESQQVSLKNFEDDFRENHVVKENLVKEISDLSLKVEEQTLKIAEYEEKQNISNETQKSIGLDKDILNKKVKECMNESFLSIMNEFSENEQYNLKAIQQVVLEHLKKTTYSLILSLE